MNYTTETTVRFAKTSDCDAIRKIDLQRFRDDSIGIIPGCLSIIAETEDGISGFAFFESNNDTIIIDRVAVSFSHDRNGVGSSLIYFVKYYALKHGVSRICAKIHEKDIVSNLFLRCCGFKAGRVVRGVLNDGDSDSFVFEYKV